MNIIDRVIGEVAPRFALRREQARAVLALTREYMDRHSQQFSYDGATAGRCTHDWYAPSSDANVELMGSRMVRIMVRICRATFRCSAFTNLQKMDCTGSLVTLRMPVRIGSRAMKRN